MQISRTRRPFHLHLRRCRPSRCPHPAPDSSSPPTPPPPPTPAPPTPVPGSSHYGNPKGGCLPDEKSESISADSGSICSPPCTKTGRHEECPTDVPVGVTASPGCTLRDGSGRKAAKMCGLSCLTATECGANMKCLVETIPGDDDTFPHKFGFCYYPGTNSTATSTEPIMMTATATMGKVMYNVAH